MCSKKVLAKEIASTEKEFDQIAYQNKYNKEKYDRTTIMTPKGKKEQIKAAAAAAGMSMNEYITAAIDNYMQTNY